MLQWSLSFLVIALIAGLLGFFALEGTAMWIAKVCFIVFVVVFAISAISGRRTPVT